MSFPDSKARYEETAVPFPYPKEIRRRQCRFPTQNNIVGTLQKPSPVSCLSATGFDTTL